MSKRLVVVIWKMRRAERPGRVESGGISEMEISCTLTFGSIRCPFHNLIGGIIKLARCGLIEDPF